MSFYFHKKGNNVYTRGGARGVAEGATAPPSGNLSTPVQEKWTLHREILNDKHILHKLWAVIDLAKKDNRLLPSCEI